MRKRPSFSIVVKVLSGPFIRFGRRKCRDVDYETAKKEVAGYFKQASEAYPDEAAEDLELDFDLVMRITEELRKNSTLEEA